MPNTLGRYLTPIAGGDTARKLAQQISRLNNRVVIEQLLQRAFIPASLPKIDDVLYGLSKERSFLYDRFPNFFDQASMYVDLYSLLESEEAIAAQTPNRGGVPNDQVFSPEFTQHLQKFAKGNQIVGQDAYDPSLPVVASNAIFRRKCKLGFDWLVTNDRAIHFVLTGIDMQTVVSKNAQRQGVLRDTNHDEWDQKARVITFAELRNAYRNRRNIKYRQNVQFWNLSVELQDALRRKGYNDQEAKVRALVPVGAPWELDPTQTNDNLWVGIWGRYHPKGSAQMERFKITVGETIDAYNGRFLKWRSGDSKAVSAYLQNLVDTNQVDALIRATCYFINRTCTDLQLPAVPRPIEVGNLALPPQAGELCTKLRANLESAGFVLADYQPGYL